MTEKERVGHDGFDELRELKASYRIQRELPEN